MRLLLITVIIVGISVLLLGVRVFFTKNGKFPNSHVGGNKHLAKKGIFCAQTQDRMARKSLFEKQKEMLDEM
ncbi:MAG: hypothetical protein UF067_05805 [Paludibacteraceae bacterium]|jgi:hypothetical protein|nr:hypothetical protein [Paludibacteraceae bacterium]MEE1541963.1 hypothetical protein [Paludibacteraceae bacterium]